MNITLKNFSKPNFHHRSSLFYWILCKLHFVLLGEKNGFLIEIKSCAYKIYVVKSRENDNIYKKLPI